MCIPCLLRTQITKRSRLNSRPPPSKQREGKTSQFYCLEAILQDPEAMEELETSLKSITLMGEQWWEDALGCIQKKAVNYQREHKNKKHSVELQAFRLLRVSTKESATPAMYQFFSSLGIASTEAATAYTLLVGVYEKAQRDTTGMETLSKLKGVITSGETSGDLRARRNELYRRMREPQERKKLQQLVSRTGTAVRGAKAVVQELVENWDRVSTPTGATEEDCVADLKALGREQRLRKAGRLPFKQLSPELPHAGLKRLNSNSAPGLDGFSANFFKRFSEIFEPQMHESLKRFLDTGTMPETWTSGVVTMIPKTKAMQTPDLLRPFALQRLRQKWLTNILLIQLEDVLLHCIPAQQTGFLCHTSILQHVYGLRALWDGLQEGAALCVPYNVTRDGGGVTGPNVHTVLVHPANTASTACAISVLSRQRISPGGLPLPARGYAPRGPSLPSAILSGSVLCYLPITRPRSRTHRHDVCG